MVKLAFINELCKLQYVAGLAYVLKNFIGLAG